MSYLSNFLYEKSKKKVFLRYEELKNKRLIDVIVEELVEVFVKAVYKLESFKNYKVSFLPLINNKVPIGSIDGWIFEF